MTIQEAIDKIRSGEILDVVYASGFSGGIAIGDFRPCGMSEKIVTRKEFFYVWNGPGQIRVNGKILNPGDETEHLDVDL